jgi:hypothetical protein
MALLLKLAVADPKKYRDEAAKLRQEAAEISDVETRRTMLDIAGLYDRMADTLAKQRHGPEAG